LASLESMYRAIPTPPHCSAAFFFRVQLSMLLIERAISVSRSETPTIWELSSHSTTDIASLSEIDAIGDTQHPKARIYFLSHLTDY
jgi:hypothetical protein